MQLERVRILDTVHSWAQSTLSGYQSQIRKVTRFERAHPGLSVLPRTVLSLPPTGSSVTLAWVELDTSVRTLPARGSLRERNPVFDTVRRIRSAVSAYSTLDMVQVAPDGNYFDKGTHRVGPCVPTDSGGYTLFAKGLSSRIGNNPRPATALLGRHVASLDAWMDSECQRAGGPARRSWALAGLASCLLWLGWLRGGEAFNIIQSDLRYILPTNSAECDLPDGVGALIIYMGEDKTHRSTSQELVIAYRCLTGLSVGKWFQRVLSLGLWDPLATEPLFRHPNGTKWTSYYFRERFLYPGLDLLRQRGDPFLHRYDGTALERTLRYAFWSLHCYRRGARTHCQRSQPDRRHRKASKVQVYEHARWKLSGPPAEIDAVYRDWTLYDKIKITLLCH